MAEQVSATRRPYVREVPRTRWYFRRPIYMRYMAREITCVFIAIYTVILIVGFYRLLQGPEAYQGFIEALRSPLSIVFQLLTLAFSIYHSATWFNLAPKALPIQVGDTFLPGAVIAGAHYVGWIVLSLIVLFLTGAL